MNRLVLASLTAALFAPPAPAADPEEAPLFVAGEGGYHTYRIPSLIVTAKGTLLAFCEGRKNSRGDTGDVDLVLKRSTDGGKTWGPTQVVWDDGTNTCGNPCPVVDRTTGTVWLLLTHNLGKDTEAKIVAGTSQGTRTAWVSRSTDDGATWSKPAEITKDVKKPEWTWYATGPGVGIQLKSGRLVIPCDNKVAGNKARQSHVIYSDDQGKSWKLGGVVGPNCNESQVVERADGSLLLNMRSYQANNRRMVATSADGGATWSKPDEDPALIEPVCQASIIRLSGGKGRLLFSNPASTKREKMTVRLSDDDGKTWKASKQLFGGLSAYSCLTELPDGTIACLYECGEKSPYDRIVLARFPLAWVAGEKKASAAPAGDFFTAQVRPILAQHCFKCHGPDDKARKAKLRLDDRDEALRVIEPGKPDESELVRRVLADDENEVMPPPHTKNPLSDEKKRVLKRWVAEGAGYKPHWAFVAPKQAPPPEVRQKDWPRNAIDRFVLARLEREGLKPSAEADRYALARRVSFDLIGLPPTPEEAEAFVNDRSPDAYEKLVDRLLASPRYGERWARLWLDLARYADTNGYEKDRPRSIWPYRDWVINALNADMPFDRFTVEQLAGDMLPDATAEQRIATGFHRNTMLNEEGGIDPLEFRFHAMTDRVATTGTVWLGLTLGCAQCHTHKFDPLPHREYYRVMALLDNADEPELAVRRPDVERRRKEAEGKIEALIAGLPERFPGGREALDKKFNEWLERESKEASGWRPLRPVSAKSNLPLLTVQADDSVFASGDQTKSDTYELTFRADLKGVTAIRLEALPDERLPRNGPGRVYYEGPAGDFTLCEFTVLVNGKKVPIAKATQSHAAGKFTADKAIDGHPQTGWSIDGGQGRRHTAVFQFAEPLADAGEFTVTMLFERHYSAGLGRFRVAVTTDPTPSAARDMPAEIEALLLAPPDNRARLLRQFVLTAPELAKEREELDKLRKELPAYPTTLVMQERPPENPRPTFVRNRGEFLHPTERVAPGVPAFLPPMPEGKAADRLTFARWLVSRENPLTARVTVNRAWAAFFGTGIVRTVQDFGYTGEAPSHPELLDWLAVELMNQGWSLKQLHKLIVMSATYRQVSAVTPELLAKDADNRLLARGPRVRLEAEMIRDGALRAAGLLSAKLGGPSVFPPQPPGVTTEDAYGKLQWKVSEGEDRYRRGLYTFTKRTTPYAMAATFDAPSGEFCTARREVSNTPLQSLTLLNDPVFTEAAQALGRLTAANPGTVGEKAVFLFRRCLTRPPADDETATMVKFSERQKQRLAAKELDAAALAGPGEGDATERAAWAALARALMNVDEAVVK